MLEMKRWLALGLVLAGCGDPSQLGRSVVAPSDVTTRVALTAVPVRGADVTVQRTDDTTLKGELLAASDDAVVVMLGSGDIVRLGVGVVTRVAVKRYDNNLPVGVLIVWSLAGAIGGVTHGFLAAASEPIWGALSAGAMLPVAADEGRFAYAERRSDFTFLHEYARFPQGLPPKYAARVH